MRKNQNKRLSAVTRLILAAILLITSFGISDVKSPPRNVSAQAISACLNRVHIPQEDLHWVYVPETADELYTDDPLYFLAGQLISNKVVDASYCPAGGLMLSGYANACGMAASLDTVVIVQNLVNEPILQAFIDVGTPPVMLKQLIRYESQFWPGIQDEIHYGYGHITNIGIRNAILGSEMPCSGTLTCTPRSARPGLIALPIGGLQMISSTPWWPPVPPARMGWIKI
jgi:hypothetical protein